MYISYWLDDQLVGWDDKCEQKSLIRLWSHFTDECLPTCKSDYDLSTMYMNIILIT